MQLLLTFYLFLTVFTPRICQMLSNAVKYCKYLKILKFFLVSTLKRVMQVRGGMLTGG
jgi:hypothetical protein